MHEMSSCSSSTVLHFSSSSLFLVSLLLFSSLSFFVVEGILEENGEGNEVVILEKENIRTWTKGERFRTIEGKNILDDNEGESERDTTTLMPSEEMRTTSESVTSQNSPRNQSQSLENWYWNWDMEWEKEIAAGLTTMSRITDGRLNSAFLSRGMLGRFAFMNYNIGNWISFTVTPCTSILLWKIKFSPVTDAYSKNSLKNTETLKSYRSDQMIHVNQTNCQPGVYLLEIRPVSADTYIHFFVTTTSFEDPVRFPIPARENHLLEYWDDSFTYNFLSPPPLIRRQGISVKKRRGGRLAIRWEPSPMNPQITQYCIVVNTRKDYSSLCSAQGERYGVIPPDLMHLPYYHYTLNKGFTGASNNQTNTFRPMITAPKENDFHVKAYSKVRTFQDIIIGCLNGRKNNYVFHDLQEGQFYYINVFIKNAATKLSYPYLRKTLTYNSGKTDEGANILRDYKALKISLSENSICTIITFNLRKPCSELAMYAMPCGGGSITYQVSNGNRTVYQSNEITNLDIIKIPRPIAGKYCVKIFQGIREGSKSQSHGVRNVELFVSKKNKRLPLPELPAVKKITEDISQRTCDSVTIEWWPSPDSQDTEYCVYLKKELRKRSFNFKEPIQCDLEQSLKRDRYVTHSFCLQRTSPPDQKRLRQRLTGLQESTVYVVQLIVRRQNGKALSYDMHYVTTAGNCHEIFAKKAS